MTCKKKNLLGSASKKSTVPNLGGTLFVLVSITGSLFGPGILRYFSITDKGIFRLWSRFFFFRLIFFFSYMTSSEKRMKENGELYVFFVFSLLVHVC